MPARSIVFAAAILCFAAPALAEDAADTPAPVVAPPATAAYPVRQDSHQWLGSNLIGAKVVSANQQTVGRIANLIVNPNGSIESVVIAVGGVFGLGAKDVAVTYDSLSFVRNRKGDALDHVTITATKDDLLRASEFKSLKRQMADARRD